MSWFSEQGNKQAEMRHSFQAKDQHGRSWLVVIEKKPMSPCYVTPNFVAPLIPPTHVLTFPADLPSQVTIDYPRWIMETEEGWRDHRKRRIEVERKLYRERANPDGPVSEEVRDIIGPDPLDPELVRRCAAGDREMLGLAPEADVVPEPPARLTKSKTAKAGRQSPIVNRPVPMADVAVADEEPE